MLAVSQHHESGVIVIFGAEEHFSNLALIAYATQMRTRLSAQTDASVATLEQLLAWPITCRTIAKLVALFRALIVFAFPCAALFARRTLLKTFLIASRMLATILT